MKNLEKKARAYALKNALSHEGKAQQGAVLSSLFHEGLKKSEVQKYIKIISEIVKNVNSLNIERQEKEFEKLQDETSERKGREGLEELPDAKKGKVIMRISPAPSGPMHIGNAMVASMNYVYVKKYLGILYVRIEDTNPDNIYGQAYKMIEEDSKWLFNNEAKIMIQSERMKIYYKYAEKLLKKNAVYVCTCSSEEFEKHVNGMKNCPCRILDSKENILRWKKMLDKKGYKQGEAVLRFKSDMKNSNPAFRDFPLARINLTQHPLQKNKYRVWPLMNLAVTVDDIETKITHIIRGKDHRDNAERQKMIYEVLGKKYPWSKFLGRFKLRDAELSKTKIRRAIEEKKYSGWDDPRLPTISALRKKGYKPSAFWKFAEQMGLSESDKVMDGKEFFLLLDNFNK